METKIKKRFPPWLHRKIPSGGCSSSTSNLLNKNLVNTVCREAKCPNQMECWSKKVASFLILGKECTRACGFCDIDFSKKPAMPDPDEPIRLAATVKELQLKHVVITQVTRDDLPDGGASHFALVIEEIRKINKEVTIEVLTSDFQGNVNALDIILAARPNVFNHNIETTRTLTPRVRHKATYDGSLKVLDYAFQNKKDPKMPTKSGLMVGLGEKDEEVRQAICDLHSAGCSIITIGQYLQANKNKLLVKEFVKPEKFIEYKKFGPEIGVKNMFCGPFVRSSYNAKELFDNYDK